LHWKCHRNRHWYRQHGELGISLQLRSRLIPPLLVLPRVFEPVWLWLWQRLLLASLVPLMMEVIQVVSELLVCARGFMLVLLLLLLLVLVVVLIQGLMLVLGLAQMLMVLMLMVLMLMLMLVALYSMLVLILSPPLAMMMTIMMMVILIALLPLLLATQTLNQIGRLWLKMRMARILTGCRRRTHVVVERTGGIEQSLCSI